MRRPGAPIAPPAGATHPNARLYAEIQTYALDWNRDRPTAQPDSEVFERERGRPAEYAYRAGFSWILAARGEHERAREMLDWLAHDDFQRLGDDMNRLAALAEM